MSKRVNPIEKALNNPQSLRLAINAKCFDCVGGHADTQNPYRLVRECLCTDCPLYAIRPWQKRENSEPEEDKAPDESGL